ncbi:hypothetical protein [Kaarinaea lacus]
MNRQLLKIVLLAGIFAFVGCDKGEKAAAPEKAPMEEKAAPAETAAAAPEEKPSVSEEVLITMEATVTAINQETREVTLKNAEGEEVTIVADEEVRNLAQVEVGDVLTIEYLEGVMIEVVDPATELGAMESGAAARAEPGEKPAGAMVTETSIVVEIVGIDLEAETATLKNAEGETKTVVARNPDNLKKVKVGDRVMITYTEAVAMTVTEKPAM